MFQRCQSTPSELLYISNAEQSFDQIDVKKVGVEYYAPTSIYSIDSLNLRFIYYTKMVRVPDKHN